MYAWKSESMLCYRKQIWTCSIMFWTKLKFHKFTLYLFVDEFVKWTSYVWQRMFYEIIFVVYMWLQNLEWSILKVIMCLLWKHCTYNSKVFQSIPKITQKQEWNFSQDWLFTLWLVNFRTWSCSQMSLRFSTSPQFFLIRTRFSTPC